MSNFIEKINQLIQEEIDSRGCDGTRYEDLIARIEFMHDEALKIVEEPFLYGFTVDEANGYLRGISLIAIMTKF